MCDQVNAFKCKLVLWEKQLKNEDLMHFPTCNICKSSLGETASYQKYAEKISSLRNEFETRFSDFKSLEGKFSLFSSIFSINIESVPNHMKMKVIDIQCDSDLKAKFIEVGVSEFYKYLPARFENTRKLAYEIMFMFGRRKSTYASKPNQRWPGILWRRVRIPSMSQVKKIMTCVYSRSLQVEGSQPGKKFSINNFAIRLCCCAKEASAAASDLEIFEGGNTVQCHRIPSQIGILDDKFGNYTEQDPMEFLQFFLHQLHNEYNPAALSTEMVKTNDEGQRLWQIYRNSENSPIVDMFTGQLVSTILCQSCEYKSENFEIFWNLSLPIPEKKTISLLDVFDEHFKCEILSDYTCSDCHNQGAIRTYSVAQWPKVLLLQLKRFSVFETPKIEKMVRYPPILNLRKFGFDSAYKLYAVTNHYGDMFTGHCDAVCKHPLTTKWHKYNDHTVKCIKPRNAITRDAYILFYEMMH
ncbi:USP2 [Cordylochernes scorpioides]|uniref:ubiquitinyl hydrolase 1 n=1 Tax=Cordylochernes scorpioides TaxID=51811 RepID=A0ABY6L0E0_9ARAC|nr:USP2 [Cordylochernes scorpioides]